VKKEEKFVSVWGNKPKLSRGKRVDNHAAIEGKKNREGTGFFFRRSAAIRKKPNGCRGSGEKKKERKSAAANHDV